MIHNHIESLKSMGYEPIIITSQNQKAHAPSHIDTRFFFKKWSVFEAIQFIPMFFSIHPQLVHFIVDDLNLNLSQELILETSKVLGLPVFTHFFNLDYHIHKNKNIKLFIYKSDLITCAHRQNLLDLRGLSTFNKKQIRGVIPPLIKPSNKNPNYRITDSTFSESVFFNKNFIINDNKQSFAFVVPFKEDFFKQTREELLIIKKILTHNACIFWGPSDKIEPNEMKRINKDLSNLKSFHNWYFLNSSLFESLSDVLPCNVRVFIAGLNFNTKELAEIFEKALQNGFTLILDDYQAELYSGLWQDRVNCFLLSRYTLLKDLESFFKNHYHEEVTLKNNHRNELIDAPVNEFNRLIKKVLSLKNESKA